MSTEGEPPSRFRLTAYALVQVLLALPALLLFILTVLGGVLVIVLIGIPLLVVAIRWTRWLCDRHRIMAESVLRTPVPRPYRTVADGGIMSRVIGWAQDPMSWRDLGWLLLAGTVGLTLSLVAVLLFVLVTPVVLWWFGIEPIMRARCAMDRWMLSYGHVERLEQRVETLAASRAESIDHSATELRRIERDLHDGTQARLVSLGITLGLAEEALATDPIRAHDILAEARSTSGAALGDLRAVVRGIHPPVLADRGLSGAVQALAMDMAVPVRLEARMQSRSPAPVESAVYFAVAECLANIGKHADAEHGWVELCQHEDILRVTVGDDGKGGADPSAGTGLLGVLRRLSVFDGRMEVASPPGGPTLVTMEVPCSWSSPRTTRSSGTA